MRVTDLGTQPTWSGKPPECCLRPGDQPAAISSSSSEISTLSSSRCLFNPRLLPHDGKSENVPGCLPEQHLHLWPVDFASAAGKLKFWHSLSQQASVIVLAIKK